MQPGNPTIRRATPLILGCAILNSCSQSPQNAPETDSRSPQVEAGSVEQELAPQRLRWDFNDGDRFVWTYESGMEMEAPHGDDLVLGTMRVRMTFDVSVAAVEEGRFRLLYELDQLQVASNVPGREIDYDSTQVEPGGDDELDLDLPDEEFTARLYEQLFGGLLALRIETVVEPDGRIQELNVGDELADVTGQGGLADLLFLIDPEGLNSLHAGGFVQLPNEDITPGFTWEQSTDVPARYGTIQFTHTATHAGFELMDGVELLKFDTAVSSMSASRNPAFENLMELNDNGGAGVLYFNAESGHLASYHFQSNQTMTILGSGAGAEDVESQITYVTDTRIERVPPSEDDAFEVSGQESDPAWMDDDALAANRAVTLFSTLGARFQFDEQMSDGPLVVLDVMGTGVTDAQMEHVQAFKSLRTLYASGARIGDEGVRHLNGLPDLEWLDLSGTNVTGAGLQHLQDMHSLQSLNLQGTGIDNESLRYISQLSSLRALHLNNTTITDSGLAYLVELAGLERLWLNGTMVTDAGLKLVERLAGLQTLDLHDTSVTDDGVADFMAAVPGCRVAR